MDNGQVRTRERGLHLPQHPGMHGMGAGTWQKHKYAGRFSQRFFHIHRFGRLEGIDKETDPLLSEGLQHGHETLACWCGRGRKRVLIDDRKTDNQGMDCPFVDSPWSESKYTTFTAFFQPELA
jgi:hypothetical protein